MYLDALVALEETEMLAFFVFPTETKRGWKSGLQQSAGKLPERRDRIYDTL